MKRLTVLFVLVALAGGQVVSAWGQTPVTVVEPSTGRSTESLRMTGNLLARQVSGLSTQESGLIAAIHVDAGDVVEQGDLLLELDAGLVEQDVARAEAARDEAAASLAEARRLAAEARRLGDDSFFPETERRARDSAVVLAEAALARAESELARERQRLERHRLHAPYDGIISRRHFDRGEWVAPGSAVVELVKVDELWLDVRVPQRYWSDLRDRDKVSVRAWADVDPERELDARIHARVPVGDPTARTFLLRLLISDDSGAITPGMSAGVEVTIERDETSVRVPRDAILRYPDGTTTIWIVEEGSDRAAEREVVVRRNIGDVVELEDTLPEGVRVVTRGNEVLSEDERIRIVEGES